MTQQQTLRITLSDAVGEWIANAKETLARGPLSSQDLDELRAIVDSSRQTRQRLLYMHTSSPSPLGMVMAIYRVEPIEGGGTVELTPEPEFRYGSPHEAMIDGWRIVKFPEYGVPVLDREIDVQGYQFILQKLEAYSD